MVIKYYIAHYIATFSKGDNTLFKCANDVAKFNFYEFKSKDFLSVKIRYCIFFKLRSGRVYFWRDTSTCVRSPRYCSSDDTLIYTVGRISNFTLWRAHASRICAINAARDYAYSFSLINIRPHWIFLFTRISELPSLKFHVEILHVARVT